MRHFNILFAFAFVLLTSCFTDEVDYVGYQPSSKGGIHIIGAVEDYDVKSVGTRADDDGIADSYISEMTMFIFKDKNNNPEDKDPNKFELIQGYSDAGLKNACTSAINIPRGNPTFLIDTEEGILADLSGSTNSSEVFYDNTTGDLTSCHIYIVANAWDQLILKDDKGNRHIDNIKTLADLEAFVYNVDSTLAMPMIDEDSFRGFPMIGKQQGNPFNLHKDGNNDNNSVATIPLKKLYSKVCFTMQINADQVVAGQTPSFKISHVEVFNVPNKVRMGRKLDANGKPVYGDTNADDYLTEMGVTSTTTPGEYYHFTETPFKIDKFNKRTISHSTSLTTDDVIEFGFYMPEHKVTPNPIQLPSTMTPEEKVKYAQYYKPTGVGAVRNGDGTTSAAKIATFVRIHGSYTDHNGQILGVKYDIYLGQNNYDDFTVKRNQQLNNKLIITGLTNHKNAYPDAEHEGNISIDHRVEVSDRGFNLSMERTAILDAHFEVRPLDIELQAGASMTVTIPEAYRDWVAMEDDAAASSGKNSSLYVNTSTARKGVRKYFTEDLVSELNNLGTYKDGNGGTITITNKTQQKEIHRIWFYVDENPNVYDKLLDQGKISSSPEGDYEVNDNVNETDKRYRVAKVNLYFAKEGEPDMTTPTTTINFQQWNLWRVWSADGKRYYDIEHEEEYLNNYASDQQYGQTKNGMPWGLGGVQLSDGVLAYWLEKVSHQTGGGGLNLDTIINWIISGLDNLLNISNSSKSIFSKSGKEPYYDFYLSRDKFPTNKLDNSAVASDYARDYKGIEFNREIATTLKTNYPTQQVAHPNPQGNLAQIEKLNLTQAPSSAFAYCYHKNKRNSDGDVVEQKWFLPAIDEIEDIALGAYDEFDKVFQNEKYWSCQPAYERNTIIIEPSSDNIEYYKYNTMEGDFFNDNTSRARATSVYTNGTVYSNIESGLPNNLSSGKLTSRVNVKVSIGWTGIEVKQNGDPITQWQPSNVDYSDPIFANPNGEYRGNTPRTEKCRIRAVYRSGTK